MKVRYEDSLPLSEVNESDREFQPRLDYDEAALTLLVEDIKRNGQHNPVGLARKGEYYQVVYGFQRVIAMKRLGCETTRANVYEGATTEELHAQGISNNERHNDLTDLERALYVARLKSEGMDVSRLCELFGVNKSAIYNFLTVAGLDDSTKDCLRAKHLTLNHAVELARIGDISKRLETLTHALAFSWSVRNLKEYCAGNVPPVGYLGVLGHVELCPRYLERVFVDKGRTDDELRQAGFGEKAIDQHKAATREAKSCEACEHFRGLTHDYFVQCAFDETQLLPGIRQLVDRCVASAAVDNDYPILRQSRSKWWAHLVKPTAERVALFGLYHLKVGLFGYFPDWADALNQDVEQTNKILVALRKRLDVAEASADKAAALAELAAIARAAGELQNHWAEQNIRAQRSIGEILSSARQNSPAIYQVLNTAVRIAEDRSWRKGEEDSKQPADIFAQVISICDARLSNEVPA